MHSRALGKKKLGIIFCIVDWTVEKQITECMFWEVWLINGTGDINFDAKDDFGFVLFGDNGLYCVRI